MSEGSADEKNDQMSSFGLRKRPRSNSVDSQQDDVDADCATSRSSVFSLASRSDDTGEYNEPRDDADDEADERDEYLNARILQEAPSEGGATQNFDTENASELVAEGRALSANSSKGDECLVVDEDEVMAGANGKSELLLADDDDLSARDGNADEAKVAEQSNAPLSTAQLAASIPTQRIRSILKFVNQHGATVPTKTPSGLPVKRSRRALWYNTETGVTELKLGLLIFLRQLVSEAYEVACKRTGVATTAAAAAGGGKKRTIVTYEDLAVVVRRHDRYSFLEDIFPAASSFFDPKKKTMTKS